VPSAAPKVDVVLGEIEEAVAPLRLPEALRAFWRTTDPQRFPIQTDYMFVPPEGALLDWRDCLRADVGVRILMPLCVKGHAAYSVELTAPGAAGGRIFSWAFGGGAYVQLWADLTALLEQLVETFVAGGYAGATTRILDESIYQPWLNAADPDPERWRREAEVRLGTPGVVVQEDAATWPPHWIAAQRRTYAG
jgi:hypothetical protein